MNKHIKIYLVLFITLILCLVLTTNIEARSGCCSHHGGVCGCHCCDGTSLSTTCAPYYPSCSSSNSSVPTVKPKPESKPDPIKIDTSKSKPQSSYTAQIQDKTDESYNWAYWAMGIVLVGGVSLVLLRKK